jgi:acetylornithine deacetylase/succinyl-diaminopimelate desuccinylase-like protein
MNLPLPEQRRRRAARFALYTSLVLVTGLTWVFVHFQGAPIRALRGERWAQRDYLNLQEVKLLQEYVRIDTTANTGNEIEGARFLARQFAAAGIPSRLEIVGDRKANLYAWLDGKDPHPLVLHSHIDVENVDPKEWFSPPFEARIDLPWIYGRGVFDMKSVAIAQMLAMIDLKKSGKPLNRKVLFLATSSEEHGSRLGVRRIIRLHPELVRSFWAVLTEGGIVEARSRDNVKYWGTEVAQKHYADLIVCDGDRSRLEGLRQALLDRGPTETDLILTPEVKQVLEIYGRTRDRSDLRDLTLHPEKVLGDVAAFRKLPNYLRSMLRNEAFPFAVKEVPGGGYQLLIKFQLLPGQDLAAVRESLVPSWMLTGMTTEIDEPETASGGSPLDHPAYQAIGATLHESYPEAPSGPYFLPWTATDSRFFRVLGIPSYGFSPFLVMNTDTLQVDQPNERFALPGFVDGVEVYRKLLHRLVSDT